ncbi:AbrB/MazE/SpoVT family DNA-binding domain-containing protein [Nonomuraea diastatica]|uniref:AbrB/MazE/SpoVT family DNA-binding domain-containing protein n=1 Tax=Nonomuraea diastatica TaxID=1848329 RepID=A0A4R4W683_9ACTN|nr:AbrB/MazE/SpoVT family DNA-binding domain-containing protein [Nonomuraea diastatica]TDD14102.1 AbrB/MazE/SpoVT family DNA-binding domain-containing protein [Nonomuraea diastatica]
MAAPRPPPGKLAGTARVGEKGQIVIPKDIRDMFGISPDNTLLLLADFGKGIAVLPKEMAVDLVETVLGESPAATFDNRGEANGPG